MLLAFVDSPQRHCRLTIFPVVSADEPQLSYLLVADALQQGVLVFEEHWGGDSPYLIARNRGSDPVLILDSEAVEGLEGRLATHQSVLLGPSSVTRVPAACTGTEKWGCRKMERRFSRILRDFPLSPDQVGILAFLGRNLLGLDVLGSPTLYAPLHRRLVTGYLASAVALGPEDETDPVAEEADIGALAAALERAHRIASPCPGHGEYTTLHGEVTGGELRHNGHLVHLSILPNGAAA